MATRRTIEFFEGQFQRLAGEPGGLSAFQEAALPHLSGRVLDLACGLGTLSLEAARRGCEVLAVDASPTAIAHVSAAANAERLPVTAVQADVEHYPIPGTFDAVAAIGILMFFPREVARWRGGDERPRCERPPVTRSEESGASAARGRADPGSGASG